jgi:hypothetical protein
MRHKEWQNYYNKVKKNTFDLLSAYLWNLWVSFLSAEKYGRQELGLLYSAQRWVLPDHITHK